MQRVRRLNTPVSAPTLIRSIGRSRILALACAATGVTLGCAAAGSQAAIVYRTVALTGTDGPLGPGEGAGVTFFAIDGQQPTMNNAGQVAFRGQDSTTGNPNGVWVNNGATTNSVVALNGQSMPGGGTYPTGTAALFNNTLINQAGQTAWRLGAGSGVFGNDGATSYRPSYAGDNAPETTTSGPLATYSSVASGMPLLNTAGQVGFVANLTTNASLTPPVVITSGVGNSSGVWIGAPGNPHLVLRQNDTLLGLDGTGNTRVGTIAASSMSLNNVGRYVLSAGLQGSNVVTGSGAGSNSQMIVTNRGGSLAVIARNGDASPDTTGTPTADLYRSLSTSAQVAFNDLGHVAFATSLRNAAGTQTSAGALFTDAGSGTLRRIANVGEAMPTIYSRTGSALSEFNGVTWGSIYGNTYFNANDQLLVVSSGWANTGGSSNTSGMMLYSGGSWQKIERTGDVAIPGGAPSGSDAFFGSTSGYQLNAAGQVAFFCSLTGTQVSGGFNNAQSLWVSDLDGSLLKIARAGDLFEVAPGDSRTVLSIGGLPNTGGQDGHGVSLTDNGQLAFELNFTNGTSGIFVAQVPEPAGALGAGLAALGCLRRRRRSSN